MSAGSTFTGGVDSFFTAVTRARELRMLLYVRGYDIKLRNTTLLDRVSASLSSAAQRLGLPLVEMETNARPAFTDRYWAWNLSFGAALAAAAIMLAARIDHFYIPAGQAYPDLQPDGAHPSLNPLFSTDYLTFETDGCEASRFEKTGALSGNDIAMEHLRVCWRNPGNRYNCCRCEKCLRTMAALEVLGALERCQTFDRPLVYRRLARTSARSPGLAFFMQENIAAAKRLGADSGLVSAMEESLRRTLHPGPVRRSFMSLRSRLADGALRQRI